MYNCPVPYHGPNRKCPRIWNFLYASVDMYSSQHWSNVFVFSDVIPTLFPQYLFCQIQEVSSCHILWYWQENQGILLEQWVHMLVMNKSNVASVCLPSASLIFVQSYYLTRSGCAVKGCDLCRLKLRKYWVIALVLQFHLLKNVSFPILPLLIFLSVLLQNYVSFSLVLIVLSV
jgi:hypothetical protein